MTIEATAALYRSLLDYAPATGVLTWKPREDPAWNARYAGESALSNVSHGYLRGKIGGQNVRAHRIIWIMVYGEEPDQIDHINGDRADNRLSNLRNVSAQENARNKKHIPNSSGVTGVVWDATFGKWKSRIRLSGVEKTLGYFANLVSAISARKKAERDNDFHPNHGRTA